MYWITLILLGFFLGLMFVSRKEEAPDEIQIFLKPFYKIARYLYKKISTRCPKLFSSRQVEKDLRQLYPGEAGECLKTDYYVKKAAVCLVVVFVGTLFGAAAKFSAQGKVILGEGGVVARGSYEEGEREIIISVNYGSGQLDFQVHVEPRQLTGDEREALFETFLEYLPQYILGDNENLQTVIRDLSLKESYGDFPIVVEWLSDSPDVLTSTGSVSAVETVQQVSLMAKLDYNGWERQEELLVTVVPAVLTEEEQLYREIKELLSQSQSQNPEQEKWQLPTEWRGEELHWRQVVEDNSTFLWAAAMASAAAVYLLSDRDLHEKLEKRKKILRREYPEILHKLVLFIGAGMTIRGAFQKMVGDYETKLKNGGKRSPAYEEMAYTCRELRAGVSEGSAYESFGKRTGLQEYIRLSTLLMQNLKRGNSTLLERLWEEADKAGEERLQQSKKLGEEAGTKLLVPMVLMLAVVMVIIMIPAFSAI